MLTSPDLPAAEIRLEPYQEPTEYLCIAGKLYYQPEGELFLIPVWESFVIGTLPPKAGAKQVRCMAVD